MQTRFPHPALIAGTIAAAVGCSRTGLIGNRVSADDSMASASTAGAPSGAVDSDNPCKTTRLTVTRASPSVLFVLDRSPSMGTTMDGSGTSTRWEALRNALASALPAIDESVTIGAVLFPTPGSSSSCTVASGVDLAPALNNVGSLISLLEANSPRGATPTYAAILSASNAILRTRASRGSRALVLATDGSPDCNADLDPTTCRCVADASPCPRATQCLDDERTITLIGNLYAQGLPTYVIGIQSAGDERFTDVLEAMAIAGGGPRQDRPQAYYAASTEPGLTEALSTIRDQVKSCVYLTTTIPDSQAQVQLALRGETVLGSAWSWQDKANGELLLGTALCNAIAEDSDIELEQSVGCDGP